MIGWLLRCLPCLSLFEVTSIKLKELSRGETRWLVTKVTNSLSLFGRYKMLDVRRGYSFNFAPNHLYLFSPPNTMQFSLFFLTTLASLLGFASALDRRCDCPALAKTRDLQNVLKSPLGIQNAETGNVECTYKNAKESVTCIYPVRYWFF